MAEYSITNSSPRYTMQSTYQTYTKVTGANTFRWSNATNAQQQVRFDFSEIPNGSTINAVDWNYRYSDSYGGTGYQTIRDGGQLWDYASNASIKRWLEERSKVIILMTSFRGNDGIETAGTTPPKATRTVNTLSIKVTYTTADGTSYVKYCTADGWQKCEPYFIVNGEAQRCDAYYGDDGEWVKVSTDE